MRPLAAIFALLVGAAGWFYLFYSRAARRLEGVEDHRLNRRRVRLRQVGGILMMLLAACFFALFWRVDLDQPGAEGLIFLTAVTILLLAILVLGMIDLRLTYQLRRRQPPAKDSRRP